MSDSNKRDDIVTEDDLEKLKEFVGENLCKIRECNYYHSEYLECTSLKGRFHQYFIYGEFLDCSSWKEDTKDCNKCSSLDYKACANIIFHENERKKKRLEAHKANDVWKRRKEPPPEWNKELPEWFYKKNDSSVFVSQENPGKCVIF